MLATKQAPSIRTLAILALLITALGYSLLNVGSRFLAEGFPPMTQVYMRVSLATLLLTVLFWKKLRWEKIRSMPSRDAAVICSMGTIGFSICVYFITLAVLTTKLVSVTIVYASVPFFSYLYSYLFLKKPVNPRLIALLIVSLIGISFLASRSFTPSLSQFGLGEWYALIATATAAWFYVGRKLLSDHLNTQEITVTVMIVASVSAIAFALPGGETFQLSAFTNPIVLIGLAIGIGMNALVNPIEIFAFKHLDAVLGSQILLLDNVFSLFLGYVLYREIISLPELAGGAIVIGCVYAANRLPQST